MSDTSDKMVAAIGLDAQILQALEKYLAILERRKKPLDEEIERVTRFHDALTERVNAKIIAVAPHLADAAQTPILRAKDHPESESAK